MTNFQTLISSLNAKKLNNNDYAACCPAHEDSTPSLMLCEKEDKILLHCFAGCSQTEVIEALKRKGLWHSDIKENKFVLPKGIPAYYPPSNILKKQGLTPNYENQKTYTKHWTYKDSNNEILGYVVRYDGHGKKDCIPYFKKWDNGEWRSGHSSKTGRPLYGLERLATANDSHTIIIVEGEKCADAINQKKSNYIAVTWCGGAASYKKCDFSVLNNFNNILLWPDADKAGINAMAGIAKLLPTAKTIDVLAWGDGFDCYDWLQQGNTVEQIKDLKLVDVTKVIPIKKIALTDVGNAKRFFNKFGSVIRYAQNVGWFYFNNYCWQFDENNYLLNLAVQVAESVRDEVTTASTPDEVKSIEKWSQNSQNISRLKAMLEIVKSIDGITCSITEFDKDKYLLACLNGVINLRNGELLKPNKEMMITKFANVNFVPNSKSPLWDIFLNRIMEGNREVIEYLRRAIGYSLTGDCSEQIMFLMWGSGQNGKTIFIETLKSIFGSYSISTPSDLLLLDMRGDAASGSNSIARLKGSRFAVGSEIPQGAKFNESRLKELTGQDTISARFLFKEFFEFIPEFKLWIRSNYRPEISGQDLGIWRRIHCIPFTAQITEQEKDKNLFQKLQAELSGILEWAISGCLSWQQDGLKTPQVVNDAIEIYKNDMDSLGDFIRDRCSVSEGYKISASKIYAAYKDWCNDAGERPITMRRLSVRLRDRGFKRVSGKDARYYHGISLKPFIDDENYFENTLF